MASEVSGLQRIADNTVKLPMLRLFCDGGVYGASRSAVAGAWAYRLLRDGVVLKEASGLLIPTEDWPDVTNNYAEYAAVVHGLEGCPEGANVRIYTDSQITLGRVLWGWAHNGLPEPLVDRMQDAIVRLGTVTGALLDGHPTRRQLELGVGKRGNPVSEHNMWCDRECTRLLRTLGTPRKGGKGDDQHEPGNDDGTGAPAKAAQRHGNAQGGRSVPRLR